MPFLRVEQGSCPGQIVEVDQERTVIGRHPSCEVVVDNAAVSRQHAQISESHGSYFLEDLRSRNRTFLNGRPLAGATELSDGDAISFCDLSFRFYFDTPRDRPQIPAVSMEKTVILDGVVPTITARQPPESASAEPSNSSILSTISVGAASGNRLAVKPELKLRAVLNVGRMLGHAIKLPEVLSNTIAALLEVFPQADQGFVLFQEEGRLELQCARARSPEAAQPRISETLARRAIETAEALLSADLGSDARFEGSDSVASMSLRSVMCVPMYGRGGEPIGLLQLDSLDVDRPFTSDDLDIVASLVGQIGLAIENARLRTELMTQRDVQRELDFAMQVQLGFLPSHPPTIPHFEFCDYYEAARRVGGDYFDYVELSPKKLAVTVGDVAGKGVPAALLMARLFASARYQLLTRPTVGEALSALNTEISRTALGHRFITCMFAVIDTERRVLTLANAGHMAPLIRSSDGKVVSFGQSESGLPIGIAREQEFQEIEYSLQPGDLVLMYTDGVTEAMDSASNLYGRDRLVAVVAENDGDIQETIDAVVNDVAQFVGDLPQRDDICLVGFHYRG